MRKNFLTAIFSIFLVCNFEALAQEAKPFHKVDFNTLPSAQKIEKPIAVVEKPVVVEKPAILKTEKKELEVKKPIKKTKKFVTKKSETPIQAVKEELKKPIQIQTVKEEPKKTIQTKPESVLLRPQIIQRKEQVSPPQEKLVKSNSVSKTEGSYLEAALVASKTSFIGSYTYLDGRIYNTPSYQNTGYGLGLGYKYAVNFNNFFIAPGIFFEKNTPAGRAQGGERGVDDIQQLYSQHRYGVKADFGYDFFSGRFSPYFTGGYAEIDYRIRAAGFSQNPNRRLFSKATDGKDQNWFYGAGLKFGLTKSTSLNLEYNYQKYIAKGSIPKEAEYYLLSDVHYKSKLETLKLGLSYNF